MRYSEAGKVTVGLASHWPCVTASVVYQPTGSVACEREMSTPPKHHSEYYGIFTFSFSNSKTVSQKFPSGESKAPIFSARSFSSFTHKGTFPRENRNARKRTLVHLRAETLRAEKIGALVRRK